MEMRTRFLYLLPLACLFGCLTLREHTIPDGFKNRKRILRPVESWKVYSTKIEEKKIIYRLPTPYSTDGRISMDPEITPHFGYLVYFKGFAMVGFDRKVTGRSDLLTFVARIGISPNMTDIPRKPTTEELLAYNIKRHSIPEMSSSEIDLIPHHLGDFIRIVYFYDSDEGEPKMIERERYVLPLSEHYNLELRVEYIKSIGRMPDKLEVRRQIVLDILESIQLEEIH